MKIIKKLIIGFGVGFITGFFSTGGGMLLLPALIYFEKMDEKRARATTIFSILPMAIVASILYYKDNSFNVSLGIKCAIGGVIGGFVGTKMLKKISNRNLKIIFLLFLFYASYKMLL